MTSLTEIKRSEVVQMLSALASSGRYHNVSPKQMQNVNQLYEEVAKVINSLEAEEKRDAEAELANEQRIINEGEF